MTVRQKDVEKVFCPSPGVGKAKVADLTDRHPAFRNVRLRRVPRHRRRDHGPGGLITMASTNQHAVVVGASIAGVLAAQVLAGHFERVTLVDRDEMPREPGAAGGVPQGRHVHGLLSRGREVVEEMFPGTTADLVARGAILGDALADGRYFFGPRPLAQDRGRAADPRGQPAAAGVVPPAPAAARHPGERARAHLRARPRVLGGRRPGDGRRS